MIIMVGSVAEGRHAWHWSSNCEHTSDLQVGGGRREEREEKKKGKRGEDGTRKLLVLA